MRRLVLTAALVVSAAPAAAQPADPPPFPGIAWGVSPDSVIHTWGEPDSRSLTPDKFALDNLSYLDETDGTTRLRYFLVHPFVGTMIAGYAAPFESEEECRERAAAALREVESAFPGLEWETSPPEPESFCSGKRKSDGVAFHSASGTRVSIRLSEDAVTTDALSAAGWRMFEEQQ